MVTQVITSHLNVVLFYLIQYFTYKTLFAKYSFLVLLNVVMLTKKKTLGTQKVLIEKHIYSSNRNKIQMNLVK